LRGKFKKDFLLKKNKTFIVDLVSVGDCVEIDLNADGTGTITKIYQRKNYISRKAPKIKGSSFRGERLEQIIASNIDQIFIVVSVNEPEFNNKLLDRFIAIAESANVEPIIIVNKADLGVEKIQNILSIYTDIGYNVIVTSVTQNLNIDKIKKNVENKTSIFWGASGVGKSSLINKSYPNYSLRVNEISKSTNKGKHTTVTSQLIQLDSKSFLIDTPGVREVDPFGIQKKDLGHYFIEFAEYLRDCRFNTCTHQHEPECGIIKAVEQSKISRERYESYLHILASVEDDILF